MEGVRNLLFEFCLEKLFPLNKNLYICDGYLRHLVLRNAYFLMIKTEEKAQRIYLFHFHFT